MCAAQHTDHLRLPPSLRGSCLQGGNAYCNCCNLLAVTFCSLATFLKGKPGTSKNEGVSQREL